MADKTFADLDRERAELIDQRVRDNAVALDKTLRRIEKQDADQLAKHPAAPKAKAAK